ncbi:MAG TPA: UbiA-like polyprenyltransferase [Planctomycetota bacterium]|nr:UbiA-like polyprenyltransferase [Planctomycetota bacterium]
MLEKLRRTLDMIKVQHSVFALPWAFVSAFYAAGGLPTGAQMSWILVAMVSARSAAMAFNRIADLRFDAENPRTKDRALPSGRLTVGFAWGFTLAMIALFFLSAAMLNPLCLKLAPVALAVTMGYSYTKRFTVFCHGFLGLSLAIAPIGAWLAVRPDRAGHPLPYLLGAAVLFWIAGADILYACEDVEFDRRKGLRSVPAALGLRGAMIVSALCHGVAVAALAAAGRAGGLGPWYYAAVAAIALLLIYEHAIVSPTDLRRVNRAFFHVNAVVSGVILAGGILDLLTRR